MNFSSSCFNLQKFEIISSGSQGILLKAISTSNENYAIKLCDSKKISSEKEFKLLKKEAEILKILDGIKGIPKLHYFGKNEDLNKNIIIEELLALDLKHLKEIFLTFSIKTSIKIFYKLVIILNKIHERGIIHRDLKPENLMISDDKKELFLIDFGLGKNIEKKKEKIKEKIINKNEKFHIFTGNLRYCGIQAHNFINNSKINDLVSAGFIFYDFLFGKLPWNDVIESSFLEKNKIIKNKKIAFIEKDVGIFSKYLFNYFKHLLKTKNDNKISYLYLLECIKSLALEKKVNILDEDWDWDGREVFNCKTENECDILTFSKAINSYQNEFNGENLNDESNKITLFNNINNLKSYDKKFLKNRNI